MPENIFQVLQERCQNVTGSLHCLQHVVACRTNPQQNGSGAVLAL